MPPLSLPDDLPLPVRPALMAIYEGRSTAGSQESETLEFKEDPAHTPRHTNHDKARAQLTEKLIDEAVCIANGDAAGGYIILGVADKVKGPEAFTGLSQDWDTKDLERKIFNGTRPQLRVQAQEFSVAGARIVIIHIPEALTLYTRTRGQASRRIGATCVPLTEEERSSIRAARANPDYSHHMSDISIEDLELSYLNEARRLMELKYQHSGGGEVPATNRGLLRELGLIRESGQLIRAADILFRPTVSGEVSVRHLCRPILGSEPRVTDFTDPVITALPRLRRLIADTGNSEVDRIRFENGQETAITRFPAQAVDEVITNAFIHRDWQIRRRIVVDQSPQSLRVWSPGALPIGVDADHLLTTQSVPRNNSLMTAMRLLGLAEESSRGFDRMWAAMIATGRQPPDVRATDDYVEVVLTAGKPDTGFVKALHELGHMVAHEVLENVNTLIVLWSLREAPLVTINQVRQRTQTTDAEAREFMDFLSSQDLVSRIHDAAEWVLSDASRAAFGYTTEDRVPPISLEEWITAKLSDGHKLEAADIAAKFGIERKEATSHLAHLRSIGRARIDPDGPQRGPRTRWIST